MVDRMEPRRSAAELERRIAGARRMLGPLGCGSAVYFVILIVIIGWLSPWLLTVPWLLVLAILPLAGFVLYASVTFAYLAWLQIRLAEEEARVRRVDLEAGHDDGDSGAGGKPGDYPPPPAAP